MGAIQVRSPDCGPLLIVGGAEDKTGACLVLREFVRLAGGRAARIVVLTTASEFPHQVGDRYVDVLTHLGAGRVEPVHVEQSGELDLARTVGAVEQASAVFFTGGIQSRITRLVGGTPLQAVLHRRWRAGLVVGGTSAGAAAMSHVMIVGSPVAQGVPIGLVVLGAGLSFAPRIIVDQHFGQRRRLGRLQTAVAQHPDLLGLGIDEDTAVVMRRDECKVIGTGAVTIVDGRRPGVLDSWRPPQGDGTLTLSGMRLVSLTAGHRFRLPLSADTEPEREWELVLSVPRDLAAW